jgi:hypothetical protein
LFEWGIVNFKKQFKNSSSQNAAVNLQWSRIREPGTWIVCTDGMEIRARSTCTSLYTEKHPRLTLRTSNTRRKVPGEATHAAEGGTQNMMPDSPNQHNNASMENYRIPIYRK